MRWEGLLRTIQYQMLHQGCPSAIFIHLGGNDIATNKQTKLVTQTKKDINYIRSIFPPCLIVWIDILARLSWRDNKSDSPKILNVKRKRINRAIRQFMMSIGSNNIISPNIEWTMSELFAPDGVHLSNFGNMVYIQTLKNFLKSL